MAKLLGCCGTSSVLEWCTSALGFYNDDLLHGRYSLRQTLGQGSFGKVKLAYDVISGQEVAIKLFDKRNLTPSKLYQLYDEVHLLNMMDHPNIVRYHEAFHSNSKFCIVMDYASEGDLYDYLYNRVPLSEKHARSVFVQIASAVQHLHQAGVVHRDLKPDNILLASSGHVKLADFGLSTKFTKGQKLRTFCGTRQYTAPEVLLKKPYEGPKSDVWSLGIILHLMLTGSFPFYGKDFEEFVNSIIDGNYQPPMSLSPECRTLLKKMLTVRRKKRWSLAKILKSQWVTKSFPDHTLTPADITGSSVSPSNRRQNHPIPRKDPQKKLTRRQRMCKVLKRLCCCTSAN